MPGAFMAVDLHAGPTCRVAFEDDTEAGSETMRRGAVAEVVDRMREDLQPEAFYFFGEDGQRAFFALFDLADPSQIPMFTEPPFSSGRPRSR
jgi:hypothetical protein